MQVLASKPAIDLMFNFFFPMLLNETLNADYNQVIFSVEEKKTNKVKQIINKKDPFSFN